MGIRVSSGGSCGCCVFGFAGVIVSFFFVGWILMIYRVCCGTVLAFLGGLEGIPPLRILSSLSSSSFSSLSSSSSSFSSSSPSPHLPPTPSLPPSLSSSVP